MFGGKSVLLLYLFFVFFFLSINEVVVIPKITYEN